MASRYSAATSGSSVDASIAMVVMVSASPVLQRPGAGDAATRLPQRLPQNNEWLTAPPTWKRPPILDACFII